MNNAESVIIGAEQDLLRTQMITRMEDMLAQFNTALFPTRQEFEELEDLLGQYKLCLENKPKETAPADEDTAAIAKSFYVLYRDIAPDDIQSSDILMDLLEKPRYIAAIFSIGLRKLVSPMDIQLSDSDRDALINLGYLAPITVTQGMVSKHYLGLTSKGWLCFRRKNIAQRIRRTHGYATPLLPEWLAVAQSKWTDKEYRQTLLLRKHFLAKEGVNDYVIFSFPENSQLLFGCRAEESENVEYTIVLPLSEFWTDDDKDTLRKVISADSVQKIHLVSTDGASANAAIQELALKSGVRGKIENNLLEDMDEKAG